MSLSLSLCRVSDYTLIPGLEPNVLETRTSCQNLYHLHLSFLAYLKQGKNYEDFHGFYSKIFLNANQEDERRPSTKTLSAKELHLILNFFAKTFWDTHPPSAHTHTDISNFDQWRKVSHQRPLVPFKG